MDAVRAHVGANLLKGIVFHFPKLALRDQHGIEGAHSLDRMAEIHFAALDCAMVPVVGFHISGKAGQQTGNMPGDIQRAILDRLYMWARNELLFLFHRTFDLS